jgi:hypothetical protein
MSTKADARRERVAKIAMAFPEAASQRGGATREHTAFRVRGKPFAYYTVDEHNDGRIALHVKVGEGRQETFVSSDARFFLPKYMASPRLGRAGPRRREDRLG